MIFSRPRYLSESTVASKSSNDISGTSLNVGLLLGAGNPGTAQDAMYLKEYINSPDMLTALDKQLDFHSVFGRSGLDFLYHLPKDASREQFLNYYRDRIAVTIHLMDGRHFEARIKNFDKFAVIVEVDGFDQLVFKHAIAAIETQRSVANYFTANS